ncbi:MAG: hypothetical protein JSV52_07700 [Candidatus Zixiibacteriota bacterium]|nr:MAG: hypothetical protein JSV52_07700 [candidate division Zixibacteria bacterium]
MTRNKKLSLSILAVVLAAFTIIVIRNAWVGEDAYITLRTVDNFVNGYGLTWNVGERVQAYTHPLWMFLLTIFYFVTRESFYTTIVLSVIVSVVAVLFLSFRVARSTYTAILAILALTLSKAFVDYSTSGLENPLSHLLLAIFLLMFLSREDINGRFIFYISLVASLVTLNRLDHGVLVAPVLIYFLWCSRSWRSVGAMALGFVPLVIWEMFSLFYYGFLWPNTAYAKLATAVPWTTLTEQGLYYIWSSLRVDPLTVVVIAGGVAIPLIRKQWRLVLISAGLIIYLIYLVRIGGCFMSGRLLTAPLILAVIVLTQYSLRLTKTFWISAAVIVVLGLVTSYSPVYTTADDGSADVEKMKFGRGIVDERGWYFSGAGLLNAPVDKPMPTHKYAELARIQRQPLTANRTAMTTRSTVGFYGYFAGPAIYVIDLCGLGDPLLARLPFDTTKNWRIGHIYRAVPEGYRETVLTGRNALQDPNLRKYYDKLKLVVSGGLFDGTRLKTIVEMNLGKYDHLLDAYSRR